MSTENKDIEAPEESVAISEMSSEDPMDAEESGAYYEIPEDDEEGEEKPKRKEGPNYFRLLFKLLISPRVGWRDIRRARLTPDQTCRNLFYPLIALASASNFVSMIYDAERTVTGELIQAIVTFASFFFAYFLVFPFSRLLLKEKSSQLVYSDFGKTFVAFAISTLCLFFVFYMVLPMLEPIIVLLPLWTVFVITRGLKILRIPQEEDTGATVWLSLLIVGLPIGIGYIFELILPY